MKKIIAFLLCVLMAVQMASCAVSNPKYGSEVNIGGELYDEVALVRARGSSNYPYRIQEHNRDQLTSDTEDWFYVEIQKAATRISEKADKNGKYPLAPITIQGENMPEAEILKVVNAFQRDNPDVFWLAGTFTFYYKGEDTVVEFCSELSPEECGRAIWQMNNRINELMAGIPADAKEFDRELFLYDRLLAACTYDSVVNTLGRGWKSYTAYGALVEGKAVCEGYSRAMQLLLSYAGMECTLLTGMADGVPHMWDVVSVEGSWYHLDPTWDDTNGGGRHTYFNVSTPLMALTHQTNALYRQSESDQQIEIQEENSLYNLSLPSCWDEKWNYYQQKALTVTGNMSGLTQNDMVQISDYLRELPADKTTDISLRFMNNQPDTTWATHFFREEGSTFFACLNEVNKNRPGEQALRVSSYYIDALQKGVLVVQLEPVNVWKESKEDS